MQLQEWSDEQIRRLTELWPDSRYPVAAIARELGTSPGTVMRGAKYLGLTRRRTKLHLAHWLNARRELLHTIRLVDGVTVPSDTADQFWWGGNSGESVLLTKIPSLATRPTSGLAGVMPREINRAPVLTLWAAVVAERLGHPADTALTLGRAVAESAAGRNPRNNGREERKADRDADIPKPQPGHVTARVLLLGKEIRLLPTTDGELRAADGGQPADPASVQRYLAIAFGDHLDKARQAMEELARRYEPTELNRIGFRLYEKFRPNVPYGTEGQSKWRRV